ncbi:heme ABC transporter ATP-binding protein [Psychromonas aquatilis]|uniref:Heme ABC transporter ATP-binding protein n=1 Tax=Psychromonas aquatilis TaxID=2005072 RepID=A0ABU9GS35_9GAMM
MFNFFKSPAAMTQGDSTTKSVISLRAIHLQFAAHKLLNNIDLDFYRDELTILLGPNGTGKSSLLKTISNEVAFQGDCYFYGKLMKHWDQQAMAKHLAILPQHSQLTFNFCVQEVVALGALNLTLSRQQLDLTVIENMQKTDIQHLAQRSYPSLSGGEKQRVHLARVLTQLTNSGEQKVLLMDEPTSALDIQHQHRTLQLAKDIAQNGGTVIVVLHDLNLAAQYADRIVILNNGEIVANGSPAEVIRADVIEAVYKHPVEIITHPQTGHPVVLS